MSMKVLALAILTLCVLLLIPELPAISAPLPVIDVTGLRASRPSFVAQEPAQTAEGGFVCPVQPTSGSVAMTQGYGVGSHAPANVWGAVDLAVDGNGDGYAEPGPSQGAPIVASHAGTVVVTMGSYPAGNHVWVNGEGVKTGYAHLHEVTVSPGQYVAAGDQIGTMGSTGMSSGPHLDYQMWLNGVNVDPTDSVQSCFR